MIPTRPKVPFITRRRQRPIRRVGKNKQRLKRKYAKDARAFVRTAWENPERIYCPVMDAMFGKRITVTEVHHRRGRLSTLLIDQRFWVAVCEEGHVWIHNNIAVAREFGWICSPGQWNTPPKDAETERLRGVIRELSQ